MIIINTSKALRIVASTTLVILAGLASPGSFSSEIAVTVDTPPGVDEDGRCSLIEAIENANSDRRVHSDCTAGNGKDVILLPASSDQILTQVNDARYGATGLPVITSEVLIEGNDSIIARQSNAPAFRIFAVEKGGVLRLNRIDIADGFTDYSGRRQGGGVLNYGTLEITDSRILRNNAANHGGGIFSQNGILDVRKSILSENTAGAAGGAIAQVGNTGILRDIECVENFSMQDGGCMWIGGTSDTSVSRSIIRANHSNGAGGGLRGEWNSVLSVIASTVTDNFASKVGGGLSCGAHTTLYVVDTTVSGNSSKSSGGGIFAGGTNLLLKNSTVSGNHAPRGGGIFGGDSGTSGGSTAIMSSTIVFNEASISGGGIYNLGNNSLYLSHTLITGNTAKSEPSEIHDSRRVSVANAFNLFGHDGHAAMVGVEPGPNDIVPLDSLSTILDSNLSDNGGLTHTHVLTAFSPAVNSGDPRFGNMQWGRPRMYDQRGPGFGRFDADSGRVDIGAFEVQSW